MAHIVPFGNPGEKLDSDRWLVKANFRTARDPLRGVDEPAY